MDWENKFVENLIQALYRSDQPRDEKGRWVAGGAVGVGTDNGIERHSQDPFLKSHTEVTNIRSYSTVAERMYQITPGRINVQEIKKHLYDSSEYYGQTKVNPQQLTIQDEDLVGMKADPSIISDEPVIIDKKGWVVDGRHRVKAAKMRGDSEILAWVPVRMPEK